MIGTEIRKYAKEKGMTCDAGIAYGKINGRYISMLDGEGTKTVRIYLYPPVENGEEFAERDAQILRALTDCDLKEFRLHRKGAVSLERGFAKLVFFDTMGTMKRIVRYLDEVMPGLDALELDTERCAYCGAPLDGDADYAELDGNILPLHTACVQQLSELVNVADEESRTGGSIAKGTLGALLGALGGAAAYALVFMLGYIAALAGLLIALFSSKLYDKFGGKKSKWKIAIVAVMLVLGVLLGQMAGYTMMFSGWYDESGYAEEYSRVNYVAECWETYLLLDQETALGRQYDRLMADVPEAELESGLHMSRELFIRTYYDNEVDTYRAEMQDEFNRNLMLGLFYGLLGCTGELLRVHRQTRSRRLRDVK